MPSDGDDAAERPDDDAGGYTLNIYPPEGSPQGIPQVLPLTGEVLIGRDPICDIVLDDPTVSGNHALIAVKGASVAITDLGSTNGTTVDESSAQPEIWTQKSALIRIGVFRLDLIARHSEDRKTTLQIEPRKAPLDDRDKTLIRALLRDWSEPSVRVPTPSSAAEMAAELHCSRQEVNRRIARLELKLGIPTETRGPQRYRDLTVELLGRNLQPGPG